MEVGSARALDALPRRESAAHSLKEKALLVVSCTKAKIVTLEMPQILGAWGGGLELLEFSAPGGTPL